MSAKISMILTWEDVLKMQWSDLGRKSFFKGLNAFWVGNYDRALGYLNHAIRSVPNFAVAYDYLAFVYLMQGNFGRAKLNFFYAAECRAKRKS